MRKAYRVNEKLMIISIIVGFILGIYLAIGHDNPNLWFLIVQWIAIFTIVVTLIAVIAGMHAQQKDGEELTLLDVLRIFALNFAVVAVSASFGFILGSILIGNFIID